MVNLTKREKVLIHILILMVIFLVGGRLFIYPAYMENHQIRELSLKTTTEKKKAEKLISQRETSKKTLDDLNNQYASKRSLVIESSKNEKIDMMITSLCVQNGLKPKSLLIVDDTEKGIGNDEEIKRKKITVEVEKNYVGLTNFITKVNSLSYMVVDKFSMDLKVDELNPDKDMKIELSLYMEGEA